MEPVDATACDVAYVGDDGLRLTMLADQLVSAAVADDDAGRRASGSVSDSRQQFQRARTARYIQHR